MKHTTKITIIILSMFLLTQFIGLFVVDSYTQERIVDGETIQLEGKNVPYGMQIPEEQKRTAETNIVSILISFIIAIALIFLLTHIKAKLVMKTWFFFVTIIALGISFNAIIPESNYSHWIGLALAVPIAILKIYRRDFIAHNFSELFVYPGIAAVFVPLLSVKTVIILLVAISLYDMWAVWKSGLMQKMAKYQMDELNIFSGFFIPYLSKKQKTKIKKMKKSTLKKKGVKVNVAILGGGDVIFPIITAGVVLNTWGVWPAIAVIFGALIGLGSLLFFSKKKKFYPAMPFITSGIFLAMMLSWILL